MGWTGIDLLLGFETITPDRIKGVTLLSMVAWVCAATIGTVLSS
jgi:hypothetical protein